MRRDDQRTRLGVGRALHAVAVAVVLVLLTTGCTRALPRDPHGTLDRAAGGQIVVGVSENPPHTIVADDDTPSGTEVEIVSAWATTIDAEVRWVPGAESLLMELLKDGEVDVVIGGLTSDTPWSTHAALTRAYAEAAGDELVIASRMGENALLVSLERFLIDEGLEP